MSQNNHKVTIWFFCVLWIYLLRELCSLMNCIFLKLNCGQGIVRMLWKATDLKFNKFLRWLGLYCTCNTSCRCCLAKLSIPLHVAHDHKILHVNFFLTGIWVLVPAAGRNLSLLAPLRTLCTGYTANEENQVCEGWYIRIECWSVTKIWKKFRLIVKFLFPQPLSNYLSCSYFVIALQMSCALNSVMLFCQVLVL